MKQITVNLPTSKADLLGMCERAGRQARRLRVKTGHFVATKGMATGRRIARAGTATGAYVADKSYNLGNAIAEGRFKGSTSTEGATSEHA